MRERPTRFHDTVCVLGDDATLYSEMTRNDMMICFDVDTGARCFSLSIY